LKFSKILVALFVGVALTGAVFGAAASITVTTPKLGADTAAVSACDTTLTAAWDSAYDATLGAYEVTSVTISALDGAACDAATMKVTLSNTAGAVLGSEKTATVAAADTSKVLSFASDNVSAELVANVNVVLVGP
jgi:hypothetical protein